MRTFPLFITVVALAGGLALAGCGQNSGNKSDNGQTMSQQAKDTANKAGNNIKSAGNDAATATSDTAITTAVKSKLLANLSTSGTDIHVKTNDGVVTLNGTVDSDSEKDLAERIANNTNGVTDVTNDLKVKND
jgi:osmotically-inducible protein OsmY